MDEYVDRERPRRDRKEPVGRLEIPPAAMRRGSRRQPGCRRRGGVAQVWAGPREAVVGRWWGLFSRFGCWIGKIHSFSGLVAIFEFRGQEVGTLSLPVAFAFDLDLVGVVGQTVKSALGKNRVIEQRNPLVDVSI